MARPETFKIEELPLVILENTSGKISILECDGYSKRGKFLCNVCGNIWEVKESKRIIAGRSSCPKCLKNSEKLTYEYVKEKIESEGHTLLSNEYINAKTDLEIKFSCGHTHFLCWHFFQQGRRCVTCGIKTRSDKKRTKEEDIIKFLADNGFEFIDFPNGYKKQRESFVRYKCSLGHITTRAVMNIYKYTTCKKCEFIDLAELHSGSNNSFWNGGTTLIALAIRNRISGWKLESAKSCNYKCVVTGGTFDDIHHLQSFSTMLTNALDSLGYDRKIDRKSYSEEEFEEICKKFLEIQNAYPLGVCLRRDVHEKFHEIFGMRNNTPEQWEEFLKMINGGLISFPKEE